MVVYPAAYGEQMPGRCWSELKAIPEDGSKSTPVADFGMLAPDMLDLVTDIEEERKGSAEETTLWLYSTTTRKWKAVNLPMPCAGGLRLPRPRVFDMKCEPASILVLCPDTKSNNASYGRRISCQLLLLQARLSLQHMGFSTARLAITLSVNFDQFSPVFSSGSSSPFCTGEIRLKSQS